MPLILTLPSASSGANPFCHMLVGKASLNPPLTKQFTPGQLALESFLARRRLKYQAKRTREYAATTVIDTSYESSGGCIEIVNRHERTCGARLASLNLKDRSIGTIRDPLRTTYGHLGCAKGTKLEDFNSLNCEELADRVVSQAKVRLKRQKRANVLQNIYKPISCPHQGKNPTVWHSTPRNSKSNTPKSLSPSKSTAMTPSPSKITNTPPPAKITREDWNKSLELERSDPAPGGLKVARKVVFWSEKQSATAKDSGVPGVPPSSPTHGKSSHRWKCAIRYVNKNSTSLCSKAGGISKGNCLFILVVVAGE